MNSYQEALNRIVVNFCCTCPDEHVCNLDYDCPFSDDVKKIQELINEIKK